MSMSSEHRTVMGIDYGRVRIGIAVSDLTRSFAFGLVTLANSQKKQEAALQEIVRIAREKQVDTIVIGLPRRTDGKPGEMAAEVTEFASALAQVIDLPILFEDERYSSKIARGSLAEAGVRGRKVRSVIDQRAAEIILQSYLDRNRRQGGL